MENLINLLLSFGIIIPTVICLGVVFLLVAVLLVIRWRSVRTLQNPPPAAPAQASAVQVASSPAGEPPRSEDLMPGDLTRGAHFSSQLQTAAHNLRIELIGDQVRYVVDGVSYNTLEDIPDSSLRDTARTLAEKTLPSGSDLAEGGETFRQVITGDQTTIDVRRQDYTMSIQRQAGQTRYIVNGLTYDSLSEIPDPMLREQASRLAAKMMQL